MPELEQLRKVNANTIKQLEALTRANIAVSGELDLEAVLQRIADTAKEFAQSRYAAIGLVDEQGVITSFITSGLSKAEREKIGELPVGHGLLGVLIKQERPLRVKDMSKDPRRSGFPPDHPPMTSLLGMPVSIKGRIVGDLYLTDKIGSDDFSDEDEWWINLFAQQAAVAIENAILYRQVRLAQKQAQAMADLTDLLNGTQDLTDLYQQIADASCQLLDIAGAAIYLFDKHYEQFTAKASSGLIFPFNSEEPQPIQIHSIVRQVVLTNKAVVISDMSSNNLLYTFHLLNGDTPKSVLMVPIRESGRVSGMIAVYSGRLQHFNQQEVTLLETFAIKAGLVLEKNLLYQHKEEFLSMTAHDLRAPLTAIKLSAGLLEVSLPPDLPPPLHRLVSNIHRNSERLNNMLDDLLDLTRLEHGGLRLNLERLEVGEAIATAVHSLKPLFEEKSQNLIFQRPTGQFWVMADHRRLEQILVNLMVNANKYTPGGGEIKITLEVRCESSKQFDEIPLASNPSSTPTTPVLNSEAEKTETETERSWVVVRISDNGSGIPQEEQLLIFDRYYRRALHEETGAAKGSGLGLPIVRNLVELHGGKIWVESEAGLGSSFLIKLPLAG